MRALVFTSDNCPYCVKAKELLSEKGVLSIVRTLGVDFTRETLNDKLVAENVSFSRLSVPQIWLDGEYVGGYDRLVEYFKEVDGNESKDS